MYSKEVIFLVIPVISNLNYIELSYNVQIVRISFPLKKRKIQITVTVTITTRGTLRIHVTVMELFAYSC